MRHAIMIMAHTNWPHLYKLVEYFKVKCDVFIHIDAKCGIDSEIINNLYAFSQVKLVNTAYEVNWGGTSVLESELALLKYAFENSNCGYFHLLSGQDYPVKPLDYFLDYFKENKGKEYIHYVNIPNPNWENNTFARFQFFFPYDWAQDKPNPRLWVREQVNTQRLKGIKRPVPDDFTTLYGSSQWFSISRNAVNILLSYTASNSSFLNKLWMTFAP